MPGRNTLEHVLRQLHDSEIEAGAQTFSEGRLRIWIGDGRNAILAETSIERTGPHWPVEAAARWLHETALRLFPKSRYAKRHAKTPPA